MSKHKKTRKEKIIADYRHEVYIFKNEDIPLNNSAPVIAINENFYSNSHVLKDVLKTTLLTCSIIAVEIIFFYLLKGHVIMLPFVKY